MSQELVGRFNTLSDKHIKLKADVYQKLIKWETLCDQVNELIPPDNREITDKLKILENEILYLKGIVQEI
jgi:hypothetical protein